MISSFAEPAEVLPVPAPFRDERGERWYPLRAIAEALGYEVLFNKTNPTDECAYVIEIKSDQSKTVYLVNENGRDKAWVSQDLSLASLPLIIQDGRVFATGSFFEQYMRLKYSCYTSVAVFELIEKGE